MTLQVNLKYVTFCMNKSKYIIKFWDVQRPTNNNYNLLSVLDFFPESLCYTNSFAITDKICWQGRAAGLSPPKHFLLVFLISLILCGQVTIWTPDGKKSTFVWFFFFSPSGLVSSLIRYGATWMWLYIIKPLSVFLFCLGCIFNVRPVAILDVAWLHWLSSFVAESWKLLTLRRGVKKPLHLQCAKLCAVLAFCNIFLWNNVASRSLSQDRLAVWEWRV